MFSRRSRIGEIGLRKDILRRPGVHLRLSFEVVCILRGIGSIVDVLDACKIAVIQLRPELQALDQLRLDSKRSNEILSVSIVLDVVGSDQRMAEVCLRSEKILPVRIINRPQRITSVCQSIVGIPAMERQDGRGLDGHGL